MAHRRGLAGELEIVLDFPGGWHDAGGPLGHPQIFHDFFLAFGESCLHGFEQCSVEQKPIPMPAASGKSPSVSIPGERLLAVRGFIA
jgi:hypothetical protein